MRFQTHFLICFILGLSWILFDNLTSLVDINHVWFIYLSFWILPLSLLKNHFDQQVVSSRIYSVLLFSLGLILAVVIIETTKLNHLHPTLLQTHNFSAIGVNSIVNCVFLFVSLSLSIIVSIFDSIIFIIINTFVFYFYLLFMFVPCKMNQ